MNSIGLEESRVEIEMVAQEILVGRGKGDLVTLVEHERKAMWRIIHEKEGQEMEDHEKEDLEIIAGRVMVKEVKKEGKGHHVG